MSKSYFICLKCRNGQVRTDVEQVLNGKNYSLTKMMCPKCHKETQAIATKDIKQLKRAIANSNDKLDKRINDMIG